MRYSPRVWSRSLRSALIWMQCGFLVLGAPLPAAAGNGNGSTNKASRDPSVATGQGSGIFNATANPLTGAAELSFPIAVPPGTAGVEPQLGLSYSTESGSPSFVGQGWSLELGSVELSLKRGVPDYRNPVFELNGEELVPDPEDPRFIGTAATRFRTRRESYQRIDFLPFVTGGFEVRQTDGTKLTFGTSDNSRLSCAGTAHCDQVAAENGAAFGVGPVPPFAAWALDSVETPDGSIIQYTYYPQTDPDGAGPLEAGDIGQLYPREIRYTMRRNVATGAVTSLNGLAPPQSMDRVVRFVLESRRDSSVNPPTEDNRVTYEARFERQLTKRLSRIEVLVGTRTLRTYQLKYKHSEDSLTSLLTSIEETGLDGQGPPLVSTFSYTSNQPLTCTNCLNVWRDSTPRYSLPVSFVERSEIDGGIRESDMNLDGITDLVRFIRAFRVFDNNPDGVPDDPETVNNGTYLSTPTEGNGFRRDPNLLPPLEIVLGGTNTSRPPPVSSMDLGTVLADVTGDGLPDQLQLNINRGNNGAASRNLFVRQANGTFAGGVPIDAGGLDRFQFSILGFNDVSSGDTSPDGVSGGTSLVELNGDGFPDLVSAFFLTNDNSVNNFYALNRISLGGLTQSPVAGFVRPSDGNYRVCDALAAAAFNAVAPRPDCRLDGLMTEVTFEGGIRLSGGEPSGKRYYDLNGDGLDDYQTAFSTPTRQSRFTILNDGSQFQRKPADTRWDLPAGMFFERREGTLTLDTGLRLVDVNADGIEDLVVATEAVGAQPAMRKIFLGSQSISQPWRALPDSSHFRIPDDLAFIAADMSKDRGVRIVDVTGDAVPDLVRADKGMTRAYFSAAVVPDLLKVATTPQGGTQTFDYGTSALERFGNDPMNPGLTQNRIVVKKLTMNDGRNAPVVTTFSYQGGVFDTPDREFRGFRVVRAMRPNSNPPGLPSNARTTEMIFHQTRELAGLLEQMVVRDAANDPLITTVMFYIDDNADIPGPPFTQLVSVVRTLEFATPGSGGRNRLFQMGMDYERRQVVVNGVQRNVIQFGRVINMFDQGEIDNAGVDLDLTDTRITDFGYAAPNLDAYIVDLVSSERLRGTSGPPLRETESTYDDGATPPTKGRLTSTIERLAKPNKPDPETRITYDDFGNVKTMIGPRQNTTPSQGNATTTFDYDPTFQTFVTRATNAAGHSTQLTYAPTAECPGGPPMGAGLLYTQRGPNDSNATRAVNCYDHFGRITLERESGDLEETRTEYVDTPGNVRVIAKQRIGSSSMRQTTMELDGFGRMNKMLVSGPQGRTIEVRTALDGAGRLLESRAPFFQGDPLPAATLTRYDALDRITRVEQPGAPAPSAMGLRVSLASFQPGVVTNTDANGNQTRRTMDPFGNTTRVEEITVAGTFTTRYEYDIADQLVKIVDAEGNETRIEYDRLGRRERVFDPDQGRSSDLLARTFEYDVSGNVMREIGPAGTVDFEYDVLNRLRFRRTASGLESTYTYDNAAAKGIGFLASATDSTGTLEILQYDELGRETSSRRSIDGFQFNFGTTYDQMGRVASRSLPNGGRYRIDQDPAGYALSISVGNDSVPTETTPISDIQFDAAGRIAQYRSANGVTTTQRFEADTRRLSEIEIRTASDPLEHRRYSFDRGDRIFRIDDLVPTTNRDQSFEYDQLNRLIEASGPYAPGLASTTLFYRYSPIGNLTCLDSTDDILCTGGKSLAYRAGGPGVQRPHAPISVNGAAVGYTASGNLATLGNRTYGYDEFERLRSVEESGRTLANFTYTSEGQRVRSEDRTGRRPVVQYFLDDDFEFDSTRKLARTHIGLDDGDTLATITEPFAPSGGMAAELLPAPAPFPLAPYLAAALLLLAGLGLMLQLAVRVRRGQAVGWAALASGVALVFLFSTIPSSAWALPLDGDLNADGRLDAADAQIAIAIAERGPDPVSSVATRQRASGDVAPLEQAPLTPQEEVNVGDAVLILRAAQGQDVDADGVGADAEIAFGSSPFRVDTDRDGLNDGSELAQGSDPRANVDLDGDGLRDPQEFAKGTDPGESDTDGDGTRDDVDTDPLRGTAFLHGDQISSTILVTGDGGGVVQRATYRPYGATVPTAATGPARTPRFGFAAERFEAGIGIYDFGGRFYDPGLGRFLQPDPLVFRPGDPQALNRYTYTRNNPISRIDPSGNVDLDIAGIAGEKAGRFFFGNRGATIGRTVGSFLGGFIPGTGEIADAGILFDPNESTGDRLLAGASLGLSLVTLGFAPNFGGSARALKKGVGELLDSGASTAKRASKQAEKLAPDLSIPKGCVCFTAGTLVWTPEGAVPIDEVEIGDRVLTAQPDPIESEVDATWRVVDISMFHPDRPDDGIDISTLRPPEWLAANQIALGRYLSIEMDDAGLAGWGRVTAIRGPPSIEPGTGRVVLTTVTHVKSDVLRLKLEGLAEPLEPTANHRLYSADRQDWVAAKDLLPGEQLQSGTGMVRVLGSEPHPGERRVYNIEVETDHEYLVSSRAIRSHNSSICDPTKRRGSNPDGRLGKPETRQLNSDIAARFEAQDFKLEFGGGRGLREEFLKGAGPGVKGGNFVDITLSRTFGGKKTFVRINTVDTLADGVTPTKKEARAAAMIRAKLGSGEILVLIPKKFVINPPKKVGMGPKKVGMGPKKVGMGPKKVGKR